MYKYVKKCIYTVYYEPHIISIIRKGRENRTRYTLAFKLAALDTLDMIARREAGPIMTCADHLSISHSQVMKWSKAYHPGKLRQHLSSRRSPGHGKRLDSTSAKITHMHPEAKALSFRQEEAVMMSIKLEREKENVRATHGSDGAGSVHHKRHYFTLAIKTNKQLFGERHSFTHQEKGKRRCHTRPDKGENRWTRPSTDMEESHTGKSTQWKMHASAREDVHSRGALSTTNYSRRDGGGQKTSRQPSCAYSESGAKMIYSLLQGLSHHQDKLMRHAAWQ